MRQKPIVILPPSKGIELHRPLTRRDAIQILGGAAGAALVVGCSGGGTATPGVTATPSPTPVSTPTPTPTPTTGSCTRVAEETAGPFPADGSNTNSGVTKNVLTDSRVIRPNINSDLDGSNTQDGIPMTVTLTVQNVNGSCAKLAGVFVYLWHCNRTGSYSQYSGSMNNGDFANNTFNRGVQKTDSNGQVTFVTRFPGRYSGRATHMHFEVYPAAAPIGTSSATNVSSMKTATSQLAFPATVTDGSGSPYTNTTLYPTSASNRTTNESDNVFSDGTSTEMLTMTGDNSSGYVGTLTVPVSA